DDVWALCVVLYEMITGARPFADENPMVLLMEVTEGAPKTLADHGVDAPELWAILQRGFKPRAERWPSVRELGTAFARELLRRGVTNDITGVSLYARWPSAGEPPHSAPPEPVSAPQRPLTREVEPIRSEVVTVPLP